ncbi:MAG: general secretion pathway protein GspK [Bradyrhizobium sp.]|nr:general secretion pathway protein GspK [Pseudomonadota bacterium]MDE2471415.1 general secretion pathway protein GspK [Bradyrhizobium sp.]
MPIVSVLWGLALLTSIALSVLSGGTMSYGRAQNSLEPRRTSVLVEAGVNRAVAALLDPLPERRWPADGVPQRFEFDGVALRISVQDELGKIDLNQAEPALLASLLQSAGLDPPAANDLANNIVDWRTELPAKRADGAKEQDYRAAGLSYRPRNGPFQSVDELLLVMGMTPALFKRIEPALTVYSGRPLFDPQLAPREALKALPGMTPQNVEMALASRLGQQPAIDVSGSDRLATLRGRAFSIRAEFQHAGRPIDQQVTVRLTENPNQPYWVLNWRTK